MQRLQHYAHFHLLNRHFPSLRPCPRGQSTPVFAYAKSHLIQREDTPREVLGVSQDADMKEIKTAFRKLAMKLHPDRVSGSEAEFIEVLHAYEILIGRSDGKDNVDDTDWDFHDWFWRFSMKRSKNKTQNSNSELHSSEKLRTDFNSQLAGLRQRAAVRAVKQQANQNTSRFVNDEGDCSDYEESPSDCGNCGETEDFDFRARQYEEARRRSGLNSSEVKQSISQQLNGLKRRAKIRQSL